MTKALSLRSRVQFDALWLLDHLLGRKGSDRFLPRVRPKLREDLRAQMQRRFDAGQGGRTLPVECVSDLSLGEFRRKYLGGGLPVVMKGAARHWECVKTWSPQWLSDSFGEDRVHLIDASPKSVSAISSQIDTTTLREVIASMGSGPLSKYSRFNTLLKDHPELLGHIDRRWLLERRNRVASGQTFQVFIGGKSTKTHIHSDSEHNLFTQVYGKKHWLLYPPEYDCLLEPEISRTPYFYTAFDPDAPDYGRYPGMRFANRWECVIEPGDVLFVPPSYWHHVTNESDSIGFGFRWFSPYDSFRLDFMMALLMMLSVNPPIWVATRHRTNFNKIFSYRKN